MVNVHVFSSVSYYCLLPNNKWFGNFVSLEAQPEGLIVLAVAQKGMKYLFYYPTQNRHCTKGNNIKYQQCNADASTARLCRKTFK